MLIFDSHTGGELEDPSGRIKVGGCLPSSLLSVLEEEDRLDLASDLIDVDQVLTPRPVKKVKIAVARKVKLEDIQTRY